jgi:hypothetical protein
MAWLPDHYSDAYASNQYRALQQFFKWLSPEEDMPDPTAGAAGHFPQRPLRFCPCGAPRPGRQSGLRPSRPDGHGTPPM